jgi:hypothetical protein
MKMFLSALFLLFFSFCPGQAQPNGTVNLAALNIPVIGMSFWPPSVNLLEELIVGATVYSSESITKCLREAQVSESPSRITFYENNNLFYRSIGGQLSLDVGVESVASIKATLASISDIDFESVDIQGTQLDYGQYVDVYELSSSCLANEPFADNFLAELMRLPKVNDTESLVSFVDYEEFVSLYGAFIITKITRGARIQVYATAESSLKYNQLQFSSRVCASVNVQALDIPINIAPCAGVSASDVTESLMLRISTRSFPRGGNRALQAELSTEITQEKLAQFIASAESDPYPVDYVLTPIWKLYTGNDPDIRARMNNLESYFTFISRSSGVSLSTSITLSLLLLALIIFLI